VVGCADTGAAANGTPLRNPGRGWHAGGVEQTLLQRARDGDEWAFGELTGPYRRELQVHCYRMLGSLSDAEDLLQETLLAAWRGLAGFQERASVRTWLYRIATNRCLNARPVTASRPSPASTSTPSIPASGSPGRCPNPLGRSPDRRPRLVPSLEQAVGQRRPRSGLEPGLAELLGLVAQPVSVAPVGGGDGVLLSFGQRPEPCRSSGQCLEQGRLLRLDHEREPGLLHGMVGSEAGMDVFTLDNGDRGTRQALADQCM
jgi:hypothetical protein